MRQGKREAEYVGAVVVGVGEAGAAVGEAEAVEAVRMQVVGAARRGRSLARQGINNAGQETIQ